jgi:catechol 2,3-dioxygenase-like lactoylglutathione lyase family enzyme
MPIRTIATLLALTALLLPASSPRASEQEATAETAAETRVAEFTGELLPVFFVTDVMRSAEFYLALGFEFRHFFDYASGEEVEEWLSDEPPMWALMAAGSQTFALHRIPDSADLVVGGMRHYFLMPDVESHYERVGALGIETGELADRPWMKLFSVTDPDGHLIFFGTEK